LASQLFSFLLFASYTTLCSANASYIKLSFERKFRQWLVSSVSSCCCKANSCCCCCCYATIAQLLTVICAKYKQPALVLLKATVKLAIAHVL
jgi:hypothetical protein